LSRHHLLLAWLTRRKLLDLLHALLHLLHTLLHLWLHRWLLLILLHLPLLLHLSLLLLLVGSQLLLRSLCRLLEFRPTALFLRLCLLSLCLLLWSGLLFATDMIDRRAIKAAMRIEPLMVMRDLPLNCFACLAPRKKLHGAYTWSKWPARHFCGGRKAL
jgi:hypothetical protein